MNDLSHAGSRVGGVVLTALVVFAFDTHSASVLHRLILPLLLVLAAWLMTRSSMAVAFATCTLAALHTDLTGSHWIPSLAYPLIAVFAGAVCLVNLTGRFRARMHATHDQRWAERRARRQSPQALSQQSPPQPPQEPPP